MREACGNAGGGSRGVTAVVATKCTRLHAINPMRNRGPVWRTGAKSMDDRAPTLTLEIAKIVMTTMQEHFPGWQQAFIRFQASESHHGSNGSYVTPDGVFLFDPFKFNNLFIQVNGLGLELREALTNENKKFCVFLLSVDAAFDFNFKYEWKDAGKWKITKVNGASGIPAGVEL